MTNKQKPIHEIKLGRVRCALWLNETDFGPRCNVTVGRLYKDGEQWKTSESFSRDDLPLVQKVLDTAHTWIYEHARMFENPDKNNEEEKDINV